MLLAIDLEIVKKIDRSKERRRLLETIQRAAIEASTDTNVPVSHLQYRPHFKLEFSNRYQSHDMTPPYQLFFIVNNTFA